MSLSSKNSTRRRIQGIEKSKHPQELFNSEDIFQKYQPFPVLKNICISTIEYGLLLYVGMGTTKSELIKYIYFIF